MSIHREGGASTNAPASMLEARRQPWNETFAGMVPKPAGLCTSPTTTEFDYLTGFSSAYSWPTKRSEVCCACGIFES